jgi:hypothetical protein
VAAKCYCSIYGAGCYRPGGCADIIAVVADQVDARAFNPAFPAIFPRFVQHAIWRYCAQLGLDVCNGNRLDDRAAATSIVRFASFVIALRCIKLREFNDLQLLFAIDLRVRSV